MKLLLLNSLLLAVLSLSSSLNIFGQEQAVINENDSTSIRKHNVFGEILGGGGYYSVGYERTILSYNKFEISASVGLTSLNFNKPRFSFGFPLSLNNRFKFWKFNGIDFGLTIGNFLNIWSILDQDKYFDCPLGECIPPLRLLPSFHAGWAFRLHRFSFSPRFYGFFGVSDNKLRIDPYVGLRGIYSF